MTYKISFILSLLLLLIAPEINAQKTNKKKAEYSVISANFTYSFQRPYGDLDTRFGNNLEAGIGSDFLTKKGKFIFGATGTLIFGNTVKEDVLEVIKNEDGNVIGVDQSIGIVGLKERGFYFGVHAGKLFPIRKGRDSGIRFTVGAGLLQHKIRIQDDLNTINQLRGDNIKGFDRLTNGLTITQFLGYQHFSQSGLFNVFAGLEAYEGFTRSRRSFDNNLMRFDDMERLDIILGFKVGFMVRFNVNENADDIYY